MKTILLLIFICVLNVSYAQNVSQLDTIYYDKNWKGVSNPVFADFYRIIDLSDSFRTPKNIEIITFLGNYKRKVDI